MQRFVNNQKKYFSNNKGIFIIVVFIIIFLSPKKSYSNNCLSFLPYGYNDYYVHLPLSAFFCVKQGKIINNFSKTVNKKIYNWIKYFVQ